jgi:hypothetical protein
MHLLQWFEIRYAIYERRNVLCAHFQIDASFSGDRWILSKKIEKVPDTFNSPLLMPMNWEMVRMEPQLPTMRILS